MRANLISTMSNFAIGKRSVNPSSIFSAKNAVKQSIPFFIFISFDIPFRRRDWNWSLSLSLSLSLSYTHTHSLLYYYELVHRGCKNNETSVHKRLGKTEGKWQLLDSICNIRSFRSESSRLPRPQSRTRDRLHRPLPGERPVQAATPRASRAAWPGPKSSR